MSKSKVEIVDIQERDPELPEPSSPLVGPASTANPDSEFNFFIADIHSGHNLGLMMPGVVFEMIGPNGETDLHEPAPNLVQKAINGFYAEDLAWAENWAAGRPINLFLNGDITQGDKYPREWVSTNKADQLEIAHFNLVPWFRMPNLKRMRVAKGTGAHEFGEGASSMIVTKRLLAEHPEVDIGVSYHYMVDHLGVNLDVAHHGPGPGIRKWLEGNVLRLYTQSIMQMEIEDGRIPPRLIVRAHYHNMTWQTVRYRVGTKFYTCDSIILPAYSGLDDFARQATRSKGAYSVGMVGVEIANGEIITIAPRFRFVDARRKETWLAGEQLSTEPIVKS